MKENHPFLKAYTPKFKGEIWENARRFRLVGAGYKSMPAEQGGFFDIATANHLRGPLRALNDPYVRTVFLIGATQCLKSVCGDLWIVHLVEHESDSILCLFEDDPKAELYAKTRCMDTVKQHPKIVEMISGIMVEDKTMGRFNITGTQIKFAGSRLLKICGLNDGNVSSLSWRFIWVSEAWQHKADGLLKKAIRRADRFAENCKIFIESQAGLAGEDLHGEASAAHPVPLTWACPYCGGRQTWECAHEYASVRPADFVPRKPMANSQPAYPASQPDLWAAPAPGTRAGMRIPEGDEGANGTMLSIDERARLARWECYWCGTVIADTPANRRAIADSYEQEYRIPILDATGQPTGRWRTPRAVAFVLPRESNYQNTFESGALSYLKAKEAQAGGNDIPLQNWYLSERAIFYSPRLTQTRVPIVTQTVATDKEGHILNEKIRALLVDCQKDIVESLKQGKDVTGHFWWVAEATDKAGNTFMLGRGYATSWDELFGKRGLKERFKIPTRNVCIDCGNWFDLIKEKAAQYRTQETAMDGSGRKVWATWKLMKGDDGKGTRWPDDGVWRSYWPPQTYLADILEPDGKSWLKVAVPVTRWSNFAVKSILYKLRLGAPGQPQFVALPASTADGKTQAKEKGEYSYENQMNGFALGEDKNGKPKFIELHRQQHYPDCHCMGIVLKMMAGLVRGEVQAGPDTPGQEAKTA